MSVTALDRWIARRLAKVTGAPPVEFALWDERPVWSPSGEAVGRLVMRDRKALLRVVAQRELGVGDAFAEGGLDIEGDLIEVLRACYAAVDSTGPRAFKRALGRLPRPAPNTLSSSRENIHRHYDIGNDFYRLWLDEQLVYTCAYYAGDDMTLEQAQSAKLEHVARKLRLRKGMEVVEAGCGWGALALHVARHYGVRVRAFNISTEQVALARERAEREQLAHLVEFVEDDYRNIDGRYDAFVSVGMLEHVGAANYAALGDVIARVLKPGGLGLIHSVGRNRPTPPNAWLERRIFPGSYPPSLREAMAIVEPHNFSVLDVENLRLHYARTLREWLARFERSVDAVRERYDERFVRSWRLYLAGCAAAFEANTLQLFQIVFARPENNSVPMTRAHLYADADAYARGFSALDRPAS